MSQQISLRDVERQAFRIKTDDGFVDIMLACFLLMFVIAPFLSARLGDFWSSAVFLPFWAFVYLVIWLIRKYVITPRLGTVNFGRARRAKLTKFTVLLFAFNLIALILGIVALLNLGRVPGLLFAVSLGILLWIACIVAAYFLDLDRLYIYGLLLGLSPPVGEWLWTHGYATHHGFPITFGLSAGIMILVGLCRFVRVLRYNPIADEGLLSKDA